MGDQWLGEWVGACVCVGSVKYLIVRLDHTQIFLAYYEYSIQEKYLSLHSKLVKIKL